MIEQNPSEPNTSNSNKIMVLLDKLKKIDIKKIDIKRFDIRKLKKFDIKKLKKYDLNEINFRRVLILFMVVVMAGLGFTGYKINEIRTRGFDVFLGSELLGKVRTEEEAVSVMADIKRELSNTYDVDVVLDNELNFEATHCKEKNLISDTDLRNNIKSKINFVVSGYSLQVNGEEVGVLKHEEDAQEILDKIKEPFVDIKDDESKVKEIKFLENVNVAKKEVPLNKIANSDDVIKYLQTGSEEIKTHVVEVGESFWTIAKMYDTTVDELVEANLDKDPKKLKPGDEVKLLVPKSKITVATVEEIEYVEDTNYEVQVEYDKNMYANQKTVKVEGKRGKSKIVANEIRHNGMLFEREIINEEVIEKPIDELVVKGTKEVPKTIATGSFLMPTRGRISSRYGMRWGRMHKGLDIAASYGSAIKAADGGKVTFTGSKGSYGNLVEIDHGNGYKTRYAHCSKILVKTGDKVYKGQHIANVGNTGNSTGSHLHLEVLKNGVNVNPANFVK